jgi:hypothetical protein
MEVSIWCLQGFSRVLCSKPHESCQLQLILNLYYSCKYYPKSRSLDSTPSSFRSYNRNCLHLSTALSLPFRCSNREFMFSTHLPCSFSRSSRSFTSLNSSFSSVQVLQTLRLSTHLSPLFKCSKLYVSQLISLLPSGVPNEIIRLSTLISPSSLQVTLIPRYLFWLRSTRGTRVADASCVLPPSNHHYVKYLSQRSNKAFILELKKSMSNVYSQEVTAWFNVGNFYKLLASKLLLKHCVKHLTQQCRPDLWVCMALRLGGYGQSSLKYRLWAH